MSANQGTVTLVGSLLRRTFPLLITQVLVTLIFCLFIRDVELSLGDRGSMDRGDVRMLVQEGGESLLLTLVVITVNALFCIATILLQHSDSKSLRIGFPVNIYLLPLTFRRIAMVHIVYGLVSVSVVTTLATFLTFRNLTAPFPGWISVALAASVYIVAQSWTFAFAGRSQPVASFVTFLLCFILGVLCARSEVFTTFVVGVPPTLGIVLVLVFGIVFFEVSIRFGRGNRFKAYEGDFGSPDAKLKTDRGKPFSSPFWTQAWYEWRTIGWVLPSISFALIIVYFVITPLLTGIFFSSTDIRSPLGEGFAERFVMNWGQNHQIVSSGMLSVALGAGILTGAYLFLVSGEWRQKSTFLRTRPMTTEKLAAVRITVLFFSNLCATGVLMAVFAMINISMRLQDTEFDYLFWLRHGYDHISDIFVVSFFTGTIFVIMWSGLWIVNVALGIGVYGVFSLMGILGTLFLVQVTDISERGTFLYALERLPIWLATGSWIFGFVWIFEKTRRNNNIPHGFRRSAIFFWVVCTLPFLYYGMGIRYYATIMGPDGNILRGVRVTFDIINQSYVPFTHPVDWVLWAGLSLFPVLPLFSLPYRLDAMRHD